MSNQDRIVASVVGWLGALTIIIGTLLPAVNVGAPSGESLIHSTDDVILAAGGVLVAWRVYRTFTHRDHPAWIVWRSVVLGAILAVDWNSNVGSVGIGQLDLTVQRTAAPACTSSRWGWRCAWDAGSPCGASSATTKRRWSRSPRRCQMRPTVSAGASTRCSAQASDARRAA